MRYLLAILVLFLATPCFADAQIYVKQNAVLAEKAVEPPLVIDQTIKQKLAANAPIHPVYEVPYITKAIAKSILGLTSSEAQRVIDALLEDGAIKTLEQRYEELYPSEETP